MKKYIGGVYHIKLKKCTRQKIQLATSCVLQNGVYTTGKIFPGGELQA
jgi:hypothetical protein